MPVNAKHDAIIIGGGPAGSTAGAVLAERGRRVLILEKEKFPRYKVGESLLPYCYYTLERLGVVRKMTRSGFSQQKFSVQFVSLNGHVSQPFYFFRHLKEPAARTWQVVRSEFDQMLLDNARQKGAKVLQQMLVRDLVISDGAVRGVEATGPAGGQRQVFTAPITIDASGRDSFAVNRFGWKVPDPHLRKIAIWTYYRGAMRDPGLDEGATTVAYVPGKGWFWYIPLPGDLVSVGIVAEREYLYRDGKNPQAILERQIAVNPWVQAHLAPGQVDGPYRVTGDYSYTSRRCACDGLVLAGDALGFLDPVFSSGVFLALRSGELAAEAAADGLRAGDLTAGWFASYGHHVQAGINAMRKLVYAFYDQTFNFGSLLSRYPKLRGDLTDCLIGNLFRDFGPLFEAIGQFVELPAGPELDDR